MIVVDAGVVVELVVGADARGPAAQVLRRHGGEAFAPQVLDLEVMHVLRRLARGDAPGSPRVHGAVHALRRLPVERVGHESLLERIWALRHVCSAYDAAYVALAERLGPDCGLVTTDRRLARIAETLGGIDVTLVPVS